MRPVGKICRRVSFSSAALVRGPEAAFCKVDHFLDPRPDLGWKIQGIDEVQSFGKKSLELLSTFFSVLRLRTWYALRHYVTPGHGEAKLRPTRTPRHPPFEYHSRQWVYTPVSIVSE